MELYKIINGKNIDKSGDYFFKERNLFCIQNEFETTYEFLKLGMCFLKKSVVSDILISLELL